jgi:HEAT repeat protein
MPDSQYRPTDPPANGWPHKASSGEEFLPPVEPPPAGFILKLFVIPALIVLVLLAVWQVPKWLVRRTTERPEQLIDRLEHGSATVARSQTALDLANYLRDERYQEFQRNAEAAEQLAGILERELDQPVTAETMSEEEIRYRVYLARALGEFRVQQGADALLKAAQTERDPAEDVVREAALQAIAVRAHNLCELDPPQPLFHPDLEATLFELAGDEDPQIRKATAYALGVIGTPTALARLEDMVDDPHADTRYNAATWLAHHGQAAAVDTLAEMLELDDLESVREETNPIDRAFKRAVIVNNAIKASLELAEQNPSADLSPIVGALERLAAADESTLEEARIPKGIAFEARRALATLAAERVTPLLEREAASSEQ